METVVPSSEYKAEFIPGNVKSTISAAGAKSGDLWMVPIDKLVAPAGLNVRIHGDAYEDRVEEIVDSILANGFFRHMPLAGYVGKEGDQSFIYVTGGFTRLEAAKRAIKRGAPIEALPVIMKPAGTSMADLMVGLAMDNTGVPLKPYERGIVVKRLLSFGWDEKQIANRMTVTVSYVKDLLFLHSLPEAVQRMVIDDRVSAGHAVTISRQHGSEAVSILQAALAEMDEAATLKGGSPDERAIESGGTAGRDRASRVTPRRTSQGGTLPKKTILAAIDYAIALPGDGIEFLARWRKAEADAVAEVEATLKRKPKTPKVKAAKKPKAAKGTGKRGRPARLAAAPKSNPPTVSQEDANTAAMADIAKEADRQARQAATADIDL
jgi:hypothetical protein